MAVSINNALSVSHSSHNIDYPDGKKSLFLLKKFTILTELGYKTLDKNELHNTAGELIDIYLRLSHKGSDSIKKELQGLKLVRPSLASYNLKEIFNAALLESIGTDQNSQVLGSLNKGQEIHLNQIYTEQFLIWIQEEIEQLPASSILLLLNIYHGFSDPSIYLDKNTWQELSSLKEWNESQKKTLSQFKSKYEFLTTFNSLKFPLIKIENTINPVETRGDIKKLKEQYALWSKLVELLVKSLNEDQKKYFARFLNKNKKFAREEIKIPDKEFIDNAKKTITGFSSKFEQVKKEYDKKIFVNSISLKQMQETLKNAQKQIEDVFQENLKEFDDEVQLMQNHKNEFEKCLQLMQYEEGKKGCFEAFKEEKQQLLHFIETKNQELQKASKLRKELIQTNQEGISRLSECQPLERDKQDANDALILKKQSLSSILSLGRWLCNLLEKENQLMDQLEQEKCITYEALIKKSKDCSKKKLTKLAKQGSTESRSSVENLAMASENTSGEESEEEFLISSSSESLKSISVDLFNEINLYLAQLENRENMQLNGALSQAVNGFLKSLKNQLLKTNAPTDLKVLHELQIKEIYDHLLIGAAGLELITQAIYDQRSEHVALGFRGALIHCYYAIEQTLSQLVILKTNDALDRADEDHILLHLAQKAEIAEIKKWEPFLREMTLHLTFSYPEDYRLFFQQGNDLKAFSLLEDLTSTNLDKEKIKEAVGFCFEMYNKSISFITEVAAVQITDQPKLLHAIQELKKQTIEAVEPAKTFAKAVQVTKEADQILMNLVNQALGILGPLDTYSPLRDQRIYAAISTVKSYLQLMKISLEIPQNSSSHSLQKFIKVETLANMDKLFKQLFRAVILLENGEDNHQHALINLFALTADFYRKNDQHSINLLKEINLGISHHYLHTRKNKTSLHAFYSKFLVEAISLVAISGEYATVDKKGKTSAQSLQSNINAINELAIQSFGLFMQFLEPTLSEIKERFMINAVA